MKLVADLFVIYAADLLTQTLLNTLPTTSKFYIWSYPLYINRNFSKSEQRKIYQCDVCGKKFQSPSKLKSHMDTHSKDRETYECNLCRKTFVKAEYLRSHMLKHDGRSKPSFQCRWCFKFIVEERTFQEHERRHVEVKDWVCGTFQPLLLNC